MKAHIFTDTRILNFHGTKSHCGCIGVVSRYFLLVCLLYALFQTMHVRCFLEVTYFCMAQRLYSKDQV
jgi:hypothetical protein